MSNFIGDQYFQKEKKTCAKMKISNLKQNDDSVLKSSHVGFIKTAEYTQNLFKYRWDR